MTAHVPRWIDGAPVTFGVGPGSTGHAGVAAELVVVAGDSVLVIGSGGVSLFAAQLARALGAEVYAAVRSEAHQDRWDALGVAGVVSTHVPDWGARVHALGGGISKVVDTVGPGVGSVQMHRDLAAFLTQHDLHPVVEAPVAVADLPAAFGRQSDADISGMVVVVVP